MRPFPPPRAPQSLPPRPPPNLNLFQTRRRNLFRVMPTTNGRQSTSRTWPSGNTRTPFNERRQRRSGANGRPRGRPSAPPPLLVSTLVRRNPSWANISPRFSAVPQGNSELGGRRSVRLIVQPSSPQTSPRCVFLRSPSAPCCDSDLDVFDRR